MPRASFETRHTPSFHGLENLQHPFPRRDATMCRKRRCRSALQVRGDCPGSLRKRRPPALSDGGRLGMPRHRPVSSSHLVPFRVARDACRSARHAGFVPRSSPKPEGQQKQCSESRRQTTMNGVYPGFSCDGRGRGAHSEEGRSDTRVVCRHSRKNTRPNASRSSLIFKVYSTFKERSEPRPGDPSSVGTGVPIAATFLCRWRAKCRARTNLGFSLNPQELVFLWTTYEQGNNLGNNGGRKFFARLRTWISMHVKLWSSPCTWVPVFQNCGRHAILRFSVGGP